MSEPQTATTLTEAQKLISRKYIFYELFSSLWFIGAVWLYFYRLFITDRQVGVLDGLAFAIGLLAEVPAGALADRYGRSSIVKLGQILAGTGILIEAVGSSFIPFFLGQAILMVGASFASGADEALFFNKLNFERKSANWRKLITRASQIALLGTLFATISGGWLHTLNPRIPWVLTGVSFIISALIIWTLQDERPKLARQKFITEVENYIKDIKIGFRQFRLPKLWLYVPLILTVQGLFYATGWGLLRLILLSRFHFSPFAGSLVIASSSLITIGLLHYMHQYAEQLSEKKMLTIVSFSAAASLLLSVAYIGYWGYFIILVLYAGEHTLYPFMSETLNNHAPEEQRATVLSVASFLRTLPYVLLAPIIGALNTAGHLEYFLLTWAALIIVAVLLYVTLKKRDDQIKIST